MRHRALLPWAGCRSYIAGSPCRLNFSSAVTDTKVLCSFSGLSFSTVPPLIRHRPVSCFFCHLSLRTRKLTMTSSEGGAAAGNDVAVNGLTFEVLPERLDFVAEEVKTLKSWKENNVFKRSLELSKDRKRFSFYDGPPFATGLPHYGHILAGTIKDVVCRYAHQTGHYVERRFGWDCHGLPIEFEIDKQLGISTRQQVLDYGIPAYNDQCRSIVLRFSSQWEGIVERTGRWVDFKNGYRTMDRDFMESVWWVFKQLYDKGKVYRAFKVMPFSTACGTPLSNFEANQNYKDVSDPSVVVAFKAVGRAGSGFSGPFDFVAWTTTPWTLPANLALCVHPTMTYLRVQLKSSKRVLVFAKDRYEWVCKQTKIDPSADVEILDEFPGERLRGFSYKPLFDCYASPGSPFTATAWRVCVDTFVTADSGTGIVHCAPAFGEEDYRVCMQQNIITVGGPLACHVDDDGRVTSEVPLVAGLPIKEADKTIKTFLKSSGALLASCDIIHSYPFCWRSDTPLIYKAVPSWFIRVENMRQDLQENNRLSRWVPAAIQEKRFHNWLGEAKDWCVSRSRFWGTPLPIWMSDDHTQLLCIGSVAELEKYAGRKLPDIHRHCIDDITIPDPRGGDYPPLKRIEEVFDCWFESGAMPYAQQHYPFENQEEFERAFPANFVGEGLDQTRGWFYTLMVLSTAIFNKPAFKNLIVNGLVLAADGRKMSKRLQNYPPITEILDKFGADALRLYLLNSPVVKGETLRFKEEGVRDVVKDVLLPWFHATRFLTQEVVRYESKGRKFQPATEAEEAARTNVMDKWMLSEMQRMAQFVREELEAYRLYTVIPRLVSFLELLTNWYLRLNRDRMRGAAGAASALEALQTLYSVLLTTVIYMAPLTPFLSEYLFGALRRALPAGHSLLADSVHFLLLPPPRMELRDPAVELRMERMQNVIIMGRMLREKQRVGLKTPVLTVRCVLDNEQHLEDLLATESYIKEELNACELDLSSDCSEVPLSLTLNFKALGPRVGRGMQKLQEAAKKLSQEQLMNFEAEGKLEVEGFVLTADDATLRRELCGTPNPNIAMHGNRSVVVMMDFTSDPALQRKAVAREVANRVQKLRKQLQLQQNDEVLMFASSDDPTLCATLKDEREYIDQCLRRPLRQVDELKHYSSDLVMHEETVVVGGAPLTLTFIRQ